MNYTPEQFAEAFVAAVNEAPHKDHDRLIANFRHTVEKHRAIHLFPKISQAIEKRLAQQSGKRLVLVETARPVSEIKKKLKGIFRDSDIITEKISPELTAGMRITIDGEEQFDASLQKKLSRLFIS